MIRMTGLAALGLILNACPFGTSEKPDGFARVTGQVTMRDGSTYSGRVHVLCEEPPPQNQFTFSGADGADPGGSYAILISAPYLSRYAQGEVFQFLCRAQAGTQSGPFAVRYVIVPFSRERATAPTTRIDLVEGEMEPHP